jgi:hypothetical protein
MSQSHKKYQQGKYFRQFLSTMSYLWQVEETNCNDENNNLDDHVQIVQSISWKEKKNKSDVFI